MPRIWPVWSVALLLSAPVAAAGQDISDRPALAARINALVEPVAESGQFSGVILVARGREVLYSEGFGYANWELRIPSAPSHRFGIGSITKAMTLIIVNTLAAEGRLHIEAPVERYLPGFPRGPGGGRPTVADLLDHRAGVPHRVTTPEEETHELRAADIVERVRAQGLLFEPGSEYLYSSAGYTCLARIIEVIEDRPFGEVIAQRVFQSAAMRHAVNETGRHLLPNRAESYGLGLDRALRELQVVRAPRKDLRFLDGAGSVYATASDLLTFIQTIREGAFGGLWDRWYDRNSTDWAGAIGRTNGFEAFLDVVPAEDLTLIILTNLQSNASTLVRLGVRDIVRGQGAARIPPPPPVATEFEQPVALAGEYRNGRSSIVITVANGHLFRGENEFYPIADGRYYIPGSGSTMRFRRDASGRVDAVVLLGADGETVVPRVRP